jgi:branched-chain amino acid transport system substrate-binding protein
VAQIVLGTGCQDDPQEQQLIVGGHKMKNHISVGFLCIALVLALSVIGCGAQSTTTTSTTVQSTAPTTAQSSVSTTTQTSSSAEPLIIGAAMGLSGDAAPPDVSASQGVQYAVKLVNDAGGIAGHPITLVLKDMKSDASLSVAVTQELLDTGAQVVFGPAFPGYMAGVVQAAAAKGVAVVGVASTQPEATVVGGSKAYLAAFGDNTQAAAAAEYALKQGYKTVYTLTSPDISYYANTPEFFATAFEHGGGKRIGSDSFSLGQQDFAANVTKIASLAPKPDVIYTAMAVPEVGIFIKQLRAAGIAIPIVGADGFDSQTLLDFAGKDAEGVVFTTHGFPSAGSEFSKFIAGLTAFQGKAPDAPGMAALGGDAVYAVKAAVEKAGSLDPKAIAAAMATLDKAPVINGTISYLGTAGVPLKLVYVVTVKDGKFVLLDQFIPSFIPTPIG